ncbi:MAG: hypothetical protein MUO26_09735 [Methanotrichaceae archaeon]|nr:hypothetical protein [Methanotrichaceae archaeon]
MKTKKFTRRVREHTAGNGRETKYLTIPKPIWEFIWPENTEILSIAVENDGSLKITPIAGGD